MKNTATQRQGARHLPRFLVSIVAVLSLSFAFGAGSASARQIYEYEYSGQYIDGTGSDKGVFPASIGGVAIDEGTHELLVSVGGEHPYISKFTLAGAPAQFSGLAPGVDTISPPNTGFTEDLGPNPPIALDNTGGPNSGNIYLTSRVFGYGYSHGFSPSGLPLPGWGDYNEGVWGVTVAPGGEILETTKQERFQMWNVAGEKYEVITPFSVLPEPIGGIAGILQAGEGISSTSPTIDNEGDVITMKLTPESGVGLSFVLTKYKKLGPKTYLEEFQFGPEGFPMDLTDTALDESSNELFATEGPTVGVYDPSTGAKLTSFGGPSPGYEGLGSGSAGVRGIAVDNATHSVWITNGRAYAGGAHRVEKFVRSGPITVPTIDTGGVNRAPTAATVHGVINPEGIATTDCHFEWGTVSWKLGKTQPCVEGNSFGGSSDVAVTGKLSGLIKGQTYWYRLESKNGNGRLAEGGLKSFIAQGPPLVSNTYVDRVNTDGSRLNATIDPNGGRTRFHFEYGLTESYGQSTPLARVITFDQTPDVEKLPESLLDPEEVKQSITGLTPGQTYHYRVVATNEETTTVGEDKVFKTHVADPAFDPCPNAHVRQQVEATLLADCRAYELVSPRNAGGYDVESDVVPGQVPLLTSPDAPGRVLFSIHDGLVPGVGGRPTNFGRDPYVASRGPDGWKTSYVGLPADGMADGGPFASPLLGTDSTLDTFAFGGKDICDPCFEDGSTNIPLRLTSGEIVKGMAGSLEPAADPAQEVFKPFSADGTHFIFGSNSKFELAGDTGGSIYDRNLTTGATQVVSTLPNGTTMTAGDVAELDVSTDGSRIVVSKTISVDGKGNEYVHPYMHIGSSSNSVDLAPTASAGVLYAGMSGDGDRAFYVTRDKLLGTDTDESADLYEASVSGGGALTLRLITTKGGVPSNDDACNPSGSPDSWNAVSGAGKCNAVALAGGAGVASANGTLYFLSPEQLDGSDGSLGEPNLYVVDPGSDPDFVATIDSSARKAPPSPPNHPVANPAFVSGLTNPESVAVDQSNGDVYVVERGAGRLARYTSAGAPKNFAVPGGSNKINGLSWFAAGTDQVAIDNAPGSPLNGTIYVADAGGVEIYAGSGEKIGSLTGFAVIPCGVAIDQSSGALYVGDVFANTIWRYAPTSGSTPVGNGNYTKTGLVTQGISPCHVQADQAGHVYGADFFGNGPIRQYEAADFAAVPPTKEGTTVASVSYEAATDPATDDLYVDEGNQIARFSSSGQLIQKFGSGALGATSRGVAINSGTGHVYASNSGSSIVEFGIEPVPYVPIDNPAAVHGVQQSGVHSYADFQVTGLGRYALFSSVMPLTDYPSASHSEIFRFDNLTDKIDCVSCPITNAPATTDSQLSGYGINLIDDGRVFFTSPESLVLRDTNERKDAYEWSNGALQLISTGSSPQDSAILTASRDGKDVFFFTYDTLVNEDENGNTMKIYTAREGGGFEYDPPLHPCAASDECHGAGTQAPDPPRINTVEGAGIRPVATTKKCKKGFVKKRGKCVKKKSRKRHHRTKTRGRG